MKPLHAKTFEIRNLTNEGPRLNFSCCLSCHLNSYQNWKYWGKVEIKFKRKDWSWNLAAKKGSEEIGLSIFKSGF